MKKSKLLLKKVAICSKLQRHHVSDLSNKTDISSAEETLTLSVLFTLRLAAVFTAESQFHHQVLRKINVGAIKPLPACKMQLTPHVVGCAATQWSVIQSAHTHFSRQFARFTKIIHPCALAGEQLYRLQFGLCLSTFNRCPPESRISVLFHLWQFTNVTQLQRQLTATYNYAFMY